MELPKQRRTLQDPARRKKLGGGEGGSIISAQQPDAPLKLMPNS
jgi:hypothetical protein